MVKDDDPLNELHEHMHDVFNPNDGNSQLLTGFQENPGGFLEFILVQPAQNFVR